MLKCNQFITRIFEHIRDLAEKGNEGNDVEMTHDDNDLDQTSDGTQIEHFLLELQDSGYSEAVARAALEAVGPDDMDTGNAVGPVQQYLFFCAKIF